MDRRQAETAGATGGFVADSVKAAAVGMAARGARKALTAKPAAAGPASYEAPVSSKPVRTPERAAAVLDRAARMRSWKPSILDRHLFDRQISTPNPIKTSKLGNLNTLPHDSLQYHGVVSVDMKALKSDQKTVSVKSVKAKLADALKPAPAAKLPLVLKQGGTYRVIDGNHRLTAQRLLGQTAANVRVVTLKGSADAAQAAGQAADASKSIASAQQARTVRQGLMAKGQTAAAVTKTAAGKAVQGVKTTGKVAVAANPLVMAGMGAAAASSAYMTAREAGASKLQAAGAGAAAAAPMAAGAALPTLLGRAAPKAAMALAKVALPLTAAAAGIAAARKGYEAYQKGESAGQVAKAAAMGAADNLTFGFASRAANWMTGSAHATGGADPITHGILQAAGQIPSSGQAFRTWDRMTASMESGTMHPRTERMYGPMQDAMRKSVEARGGGAAREAAAARETFAGNLRSGAFDRANTQFERHEAVQQGQQRSEGQNSPGAPWGGKRRGWSNQARIAAAKARGLQNLPYGGDPNAGPSEWAPGGQK